MTRSTLYRSGILALASLALAAPTAAFAGEVRVGQPNAARFPEVALYAYPTDDSGLLMGRLPASAFQVTENGRPAQVLRVETAGGTLDVCLALDRSPSMRDEGKLEHARLAAKAFLQHLSGGDRAALVTFATGSTLDQTLTDQPALLAAAIDRAQLSGQSTTFLDGVYWAVAQVGLAQGSVLGSGTGRAGARRVVVALTDGNDTGSRIGTDELVRHARAHGVSIYTVALGGDAATGLLEYLARETGGGYLRAPHPQDLERLYVGLAQQLRSEYRLTIRSPQPRADATRREVRVTLAGMPFAGTTWYQAPGQGSLLVTVPPDTGTAASVSASGTGAPAPARSGSGDGLSLSGLAVGALLMLAGLVAVVTALLFWRSARRRGESLAIVDSNPRVDLLPLWVKEGSNLVGRGAECELVLDSRQVSRVHARIEAVGGVFHLYDEGSANGTWVNGRRVTRSREVRVGDVLRFGDREFRFAGELPS